jgi:hypothetical protein
MIKNQTTLDLNGPVLSFSQQPDSISTCNAGVAVTFVGIATATFPTQSPSNPATGSGYISYQWYLDGHGVLSDGVVKGSRIAGSSSTSLTIYSPKSPTISGSDLYLRADYIPSAYAQPVGSAVTVGSARSTGNAVIDPLDSNTARLTVYPTISVSSQPTDASEVLDTDVTFSVSVTTTDSSIGSLSYNWQINGVDINSSNFSATYIESSPEKYLTITDNVTNARQVLNFRDITSYSDFVSGREYTITPSQDIELDIYAVGGGGGEETYRGSLGGYGGESSGTVTLNANQEYKLIVGGGSINATGGYGGGGNGSIGGAGGVSGGGGGYTGLFLGSISQENAILIAGGGGGAANGPAQGGNGGGLVGGDSSNVSGNGGSGGTQSSGGSGGSSGSALQGGSGTAAGGGGGYYGGGGGSFSSGCCSDGAGGGGSGYIHSSLVTNGSFAKKLESAGGGNPGENGSFGMILRNQTGTANIKASGFTTPNLTLSSDTAGIFQIGCKISHTLSCQSPIYSKKVNYHAVVPRNILNFEYIETLGTSDAELFSVDLGEFGCTILDPTNTKGRIISFYPPEKDIKVSIDMRAPKGLDSSTRKGGYGGISVIVYTLKRNVEYVIAPLSSSGSNGGIYLYEKSNLIAAVGSGGDAGSSGDGGNGGGVINSGSNASGRDGGLGGEFIKPGELPTSGYYPGYWTGEVVAPDTVNTLSNGGGRVISCTRGNYWRNQGLSSCEDIGKQKFVRSDGYVVQNTSDKIQRGFKSGYGLRQTSGRGGNNSGNGGYGCVGGNGGLNGLGGGGGSGYHNGVPEVLVSTSGGNVEGTSKITICADTIAGFIFWEGTNNGNRVAIAPDRLSFSPAYPRGGDYQTYTNILPPGDIWFEVELDGGYDEGQIGRLGLFNTSDPVDLFGIRDFIAWYWRTVWVGSYQPVPWDVAGYYETPAPDALRKGTYRMSVSRTLNRLYMQRTDNKPTAVGFEGPLPPGDLRLGLMSQFYPAPDGYLQMGCKILNGGSVYRGTGGLY